MSDIIARTIQSPTNTQAQAFHLCNHPVAALLVNFGRARRPVFGRYSLGIGFVYRRKDNLKGLVSVPYDLNSRVGGRPVPTKTHDRPKVSAGPLCPSPGSLRTPYRLVRLYPLRGLREWADGMPGTLHFHLGVMLDERVRGGGDGELATIRGVPRS
jgi:hypothetical protein